MDIPSQIRSGLQAQGMPAPTLSWIQTAMPNRNPLPPLPALVATVKSRLLAADLTKPGLLEPPAPAFPVNLSNPQMKEVQLVHDVPVQVLDIDNLTKSKWEQVEELEAIARGEQTRGRQVIRLSGVNEDENEGIDSGNTQSTTANQRGSGPTAGRGQAPGTAPPKNSTHKLVVQDCKGQQVHALELKRIEKIGIGTLHIGEKIILKRGTMVARGMILLEPTSCTFLGGRVEAWQKAWLEGRLSRLRQAADGGEDN